MQDMSPEAKRLFQLQSYASAPAIDGVQVLELRRHPDDGGSARNLGPAPARIIYFTDLHFSPAPADCDEGRLPWDYLGPAVWDVSRG